MREKLSRCQKNIKQVETYHKKRKEQKTEGRKGVIELGFES